LPRPDFASFTHAKFGVQIDARYIPILKATLRGKEHLAECQAKARATLAGLAAQTTSDLAAPSA